MLWLSACGFTPMYGSHGTKASAQHALSQTAIGNIPDREGQFLRNALIDRFYTNGMPASPAYNLSVQSIRERLRNLDVTKNADATRAQLRLDTKIRLTDSKTGALLLERQLTAITSFNILQSQFTTRVSEQNARENALNDLASQIETQLSLYFNR